MLAPARQFKFDRGFGVAAFGRISASHQRSFHPGSMPRLAYTASGHGDKLQSR